MLLKRKKKKDEKKYDLDVRITAMVKEDGKLQWGVESHYHGINDTDHREHPIFLEIEKLSEIIRIDLGLPTEEERRRLSDNADNTIGP